MSKGQMTHRQACKVICKEKETRQEKYSRVEITRNKEIKTYVCVWERERERDEKWYDRKSKRMKRHMSLELKTHSDRKVGRAPGDWKNSECRWKEPQRNEDDRDHVDRNKEEIKEKMTCTSVCRWRVCVCEEKKVSKSWIHVEFTWWMYLFSLQDRLIRWRMLLILMWLLITY